MHSHQEEYLERKHLYQQLEDKGAAKKKKRTTGAISLNIKRESHQVNSVRAKSCVHLMPGSKAKRTIKIRQASGKSICWIIFGRHIHEV